MNIAIQEWIRLCRYIERFGELDNVVQFEHHRFNNESTIFSHSLFPSEYLEFIAHFGIPTFCLDEDLYLHFFSFDEIEKHSLFGSEFLPFATCDVDSKHILVFHQQEHHIEVFLYEDQEQAVSEGMFETWIKKQVIHFLLQMSNYNFAEPTPSAKFQRGK